MSCRGTPPAPQRQTCPEEILGITPLGPLKQPQPGPHQARKQGLMFSLLPGFFCSAVDLSLVFPWPLFYASVSLCLCQFHSLFLCLRACFSPGALPSSSDSASTTLYLSYLFLHVFVSGGQSFAPVCLVRGSLSVSLPLHPL